MPRKGPKREWEYPDIPHQLRGLVGQINGNGENGHNNGGIEISPRYLYLPPTGNQWKSTYRGNSPVAVGECSTPNGNQRKITRRTAFDLLRHRSAQRLTAISGEARRLLLLFSPLRPSAQRLTASVVSSQALYLDHYSSHVKVLNARGGLAQLQSNRILLGN